MEKIRLSLRDLPAGTKKALQAGTEEILVVHDESGIFALQAKCPHAGGPLEEGAVCNGRLVCPWHLGTFSIATGELLEPPPMEPLKTYAVERIGEDIWIDPTPQAAKAEKPVADASHVFLVGCGAAGAMAAVTLRQKGFAGKITAIDPVAEEPVDRTQLSKDGLGGNVPLDEIHLPGLEDSKVDRITASVVDVRSGGQSIRLSDGRVLHFDKMLLATGGRPKLLKIPGAELAHTIRHPDDVRRILAAAENKKEVVILGTSFIALEAASALVQRGFKVTVAGRERRPFARQFGEEVARTLQGWHEKGGTHFRLGVEISRITREGVVVLADQREETLPADLVLMGVGVTVDPDFEHDLPRAEVGGIRTDDSLKASEKVWVAGDMAALDGKRIEHWRVAQQHGRRAALSMLDVPSQERDVPFFWTYHFGKTLGYLGHADTWDGIFQKGSLDDDNFMVFYTEKNQVKAVLNCGFETQMATLAEPMRNNLMLQDALRLIE